MLFFEFLLILGLIAFCKFCIKKIRALHNLLLGCTFLSSGGFLLFGFFIEFFIRARWDIVNILSEVFTRFVTRYGLNNGWSNQIGGYNTKLTFFLERFLGAGCSLGSAFFLGAALFFGFS